MDDYLSPVDKLLTYGDAREFDGWPNYLELGLTHKDIPELIRMLTDEELFFQKSDSLEVWASLHAWRALGQLQAIDAIEPLLRQLHKIDDDDWVNEEFPEVFAMIGAPAITHIDYYLKEMGGGLSARITAASSLEMIGNSHPETRGKCVKVLTENLTEFADNDPTFNAFLISYLTDLKAVESLPVIQEAYEHDLVDLSIQGDLEDTEIELGVRVERETPGLYADYQYLDAFLDDNTSFLDDNTFIREKVKVGRNDPCPCGSGKKYKKCCLNKKEK